MYPIKIYTDASKEGDNVGYAWLASIGDYIVDQDIVSARDITVYKAEVLAIREALSWLKLNFESDRANIIYCDSDSAVKALNEHNAKDWLSLEVLSRICDIREDTSLDVKWIKGHNGDTGNECADAMARIGASEAKKLSYVSPFMPMSKRALKKIIHEEYISDWRDRWKQQRGCRISKLFIPEVMDKDITSKKSVKELQKITQWMTGHGLFKKHLRHWNELETYNCTLCEEDWEDSWHLWEMCPKLTKHREVTRKLISKGLALESGILRFAQLDELQELVALNESLITPS